MIAHRRWLAGLVTAAAAIGCSDGGGSGDGQQQLLADALTAALQFTNAATTPGPPPAGHASDPAFPQATAFDVPSPLPFGNTFALTVRTDFAETGRIAGAVLHVEHATEHLVVSAPYEPATGSVNLLGRIVEDPEIRSQSFAVRVGLLDDAGEAGNYLTWTLDLPAADEPEPDAGADSESG